MIPLITALVRDLAAMVLGFILVAFLALVITMTLQRATDPAQPAPPAQVAGSGQ